MLWDESERPTRDNILLPFTFASRLIYEAQPMSTEFFETLLLFIQSYVINKTNQLLTVHRLYAWQMSASSVNSIIHKIQCQIVQNAICHTVSETKTSRALDQLTYWARPVEKYKVIYFFR